MEKIIDPYSDPVAITFVISFVLFCIFSFRKEIKDGFKEAQKLNNEKIKIPPPS